VRPHAYMYGKKLDERDFDKQSTQLLNTKKMREPPPAHEFSYRWYRGPLHETCAYEACPRRTSFAPHDWSRHALGGADSALQCVSTQSSLYHSTFCNASCFVNAWKTQFTIPRESREHSNSTGQNSNGMPGSSAGARAMTPLHSRSASFNSNDGDFDDIGSNRSTGSKSPTNMMYTPDNMPSESYGNSGPLRGFFNGASNGNAASYFSDSTEFVEVSREQVYLPGPEDVGRKLKLEAAAYSTETGELLMSRVVKTDVVLSRAPEPQKRNLVTAKGVAGAGNGPRFRVATYNVLAEIYATQQQYPYCDFWALNWDYRFQNILREVLDAVRTCTFE
jgi:CCR4-NOT transcription complex subunit 6